MKDDTVEVLVRIPKHDYDYILGQGDTRGTSHLAEAICNGTVLPKGHGRLIDADTYRKEMLDSREFDFFKRLDMQPTIIEADKDGE